MKSDSFCPAPFHSLHLHPQGKWRVCCISRTDLESNPIESWDSAKTKDIRKEFLEGQKPQSCMSCWHKEDLGGTSQRHRLIQALSHQDIAQKSQKERPLSQDMSLESILYLDLSFSNRCNLKCRFCGPHNSSNWHKDSQALLENNYKFWKNEFSAKQRIYDADLDQLLGMIERLPNLKYLEIKGGEPFIDEKHLLFLKALVEKNLAQDLILTITTNGTLISDEYFEYLDKFEAIYMTCSVDGTGSMYQYIRGGNYSLEGHVVPNLKKLNQLKNLTLNIHFTLCSYNIFNIQDTYDWYLKLKEELKTINRWQFGIIHGPQSLSHLALPAEFKQPAIESINKSIEDLAKLAETLTQKPQTEYYLSGQGLKDFWTYTSELDAIRGDSLLDIEPRFKDLASIKNLDRT